MTAIPVEKLFDKKQIVWTIFADDEQDIRTVYGGFLSTLLRASKPTLQDPRRYMVRIVDGKATAEEQYDTLIKEGHKVGLVLTDRNMEYDNAGFDLLKRIKETNKHTRRAMLTGYPEYSLLRDGIIHSFLVKASSAGDQEQELGAIVLAELRNFFDNEELMAVARNHQEQARAVGLANDALQAALTRAEERLPLVAHEQGQRPLGLRYLLREVGKTPFDARMEHYFRQLLGEDYLVLLDNEQEPIAKRGFKVTNEGIFYHDKKIVLPTSDGMLEKGLYGKQVDIDVKGTTKKMYILVKSKKTMAYISEVLGDLTSILALHLQLSESQEQEKSGGWGVEDSLSGSPGVGSSEAGESSLYGLSFEGSESVVEIIDGPTMSKDELVTLVREMFPYAIEETDTVMIGKGGLYTVDENELTKLLGAYQSFFAHTAEGEVCVTMKDLPKQYEIIFHVPYKNDFWLNDQLQQTKTELGKQTTRASCKLYITEHLAFGELSGTTRQRLKEATPEFKLDVLDYYQRLNDEEYLNEPTKITESMYQEGRIEFQKAEVLQLVRNLAINAMLTNDKGAPVAVSTLEELLKKNAERDPPLFNTTGNYKLVIYK